MSDYFSYWFYAVANPCEESNRSSKLVSLELKAVHASLFSWLLVHIETCFSIALELSLLWNLD